MQAQFDYSAHEVTEIVLNRFKVEFPTPYEMEWVAEPQAYLSGGVKIRLRRLGEGNEE